MAIVDDDTGTLGTIAKFQTFALEIANNGGVIQHRIIGESTAPTASAFADKITGASATYANSPSLSSSVGFTSGGGIDSTGTQRFVLNTGAQVDSQFGLLAVMGRNSTATSGLVAEPRYISLNVNGTTRNRLAIGIITSTGVAHAITTANIGSGTMLRIRVFGWLL